MNKLLTLILFGAIFCLNSSAQKVDFKVTLNMPSGADTTKGSIEVEITEGIPPFTCYLFSDRPWVGGKLLQKKENLNVSVTSFNNLAAGSYFVLVEDSRNDNPKGITVIINQKKE